MPTYTEPIVGTREICEGRPALASIDLPNMDFMRAVSISAISLTVTFRLQKVTSHCGYLAAA